MYPVLDHPIEGRASSICENPRKDDVGTSQGNEQNRTQKGRLKRVGGVKRRADPGLEKNKREDQEDRKGSSEEEEAKGDGEDEQDGRERGEGRAVAHGEMRSQWLTALQLNNKEETHAAPVVDPEGMLVPPTPAEADAPAAPAPAVPDAPAAAAVMTR